MIFLSRTALQMEKLDQELMFVANKRLSTDQLLMVVGLKQEIGQMPTKGSAAGVFDSGLDLLPSVSFNFQLILKLIIKS